MAFLMGLGNPENMRVLQQYGFDQAALDEGWTLLRRAANNRLGVQRHHGPPAAAPARLPAHVAGRRRRG